MSAADEPVLSAEPSVNALLRTTCVATQLEASNADNVLPTRAVAVVNCRILPDETREATRATLAKVIGDPAIAIEALDDIGVAPASATGGEATGAIREVAERMWPGVPVVHAMGTGASDSRFLRAHGIPAYGIGAAPGTLEDAVAGRAAHGPDERRPLAWLAPGVRFLDDVVRRLTQ